MRLIDVDALMQSLGITNMDCDECAWQDKRWGLCKRGGDFEDVCCAIEDAPIIEERKKGRWVDVTNYSYDNYGFYKCSDCGHMTRQRYNFCPRCGADMREEEDDQRTT